MILSDFVESKSRLDESQRTGSFRYKNFTLTEQIF